MKRREFVEKVGVGSAAAVAALAGGVMAKTPGAPLASQHGNEDHGHDSNPVKGTLASATVSFGQWRSDPPLDRYPYPQPPGPPPGNVHKLIPYQVTIKVGGSVNFIIAGLHHVLVYAPGKRPEDVNTAATRPTQGTPPGPPLINDTVDRLYAGLDPTTIHGGPPNPRNPLLERVEVVQFTRKGRHLVICGVLPHFVNDNMYGWVKVVGDDEDED
jgi:hypothetical protein